jgi:hypothetical protein
MAVASFGLGRKPNPLGHADRLHARRIVDPAPGQIQLPTDHGVPGVGGVHQVDRDLGVLHPTRGAGVLALHPDGVGPLLQIAGLVDYQRRLGSPR